MPVTLSVLVTIVARRAIHVPTAVRSRGLPTGLPLVCRHSSGNSKAFLILVARISAEKILKMNIFNVKVISSLTYKCRGWINARSKDAMRMNPVHSWMHCQKFYFSLLTNALLLPNHIHFLLTFLMSQKESCILHELSAY